MRTTPRSLGLKKVFGYWRLIQGETWVCFFRDEESGSWTWKAYGDSKGDREGCLYKTLALAVSDARFEVFGEDSEDNA